MNFDPIHWAAVGLGVALIVALVALGVQSTRLNTRTLELNAYVAEVKAAESKHREDFAVEKLAIVNRNIELEGKYHEAKIALDAAYIEYDRMRKSADAHAKISLSHAASKFTECRSDAAGQPGNLESNKNGIRERLERLDSAVISRLARSRDDTILLLNQCLAFVQHK